ncbi:uncharacterized protein EDB91DRAFT_1057851, partial [Suillus paluster]|uniref:uncharacterized protein n=1 Tax=Suillus paluster TaxID=48578 RepID=UPI001B8689FD
VHYYDIATGSLDIRPIGKVYGISNLYQDVRNTEDVNELETKLADLEHQAASIIEDLHRALPQGTFTLKHRSLELLRKFLFIMHYRNVSCSSQYFQADHLDNVGARQWIESFMKAKGLQSAVEMWLHVLRYYLDTSHSDYIVRDAAELIEKYGEVGLVKMIAELHIPPDLEHYQAVAYHGQANSYFFSIWEAAEGEEFILMHNSFSLWEGLAGGYPGLHRIFVVSPRIAIVLRCGLLRSLKNSLLNTNPAPPTYASGKDGIISHADFQSARSLECYRLSDEGGNNGFVFKITKLSRPQTLELNSVVLTNMKQTDSLTFLSRESMLCTARAFRSLPSNFPESDLVVPLIARLTTSMRADVSALHPLFHSPVAVPNKDSDALSLVDVVLYVLLMQISTGCRQFHSVYNRAHLVLKIMEKAKPNSFADEISRESYYRLMACIIQCLDTVMRSPPEPYSLQLRNARLVVKMPKAHSDLLFLTMKEFIKLMGSELSLGEDTGCMTISKRIEQMVIVGVLAWFVKHRRNSLDFIVSQFLPDMNFKLLEDEEGTGTA